MTLLRFTDNKKFGKISYWHCAIYFLIFLCLGCFVRDIPGQPDLHATIENFMSPPEVTKLGDPTYFASGAIDIYKYNWIRQENQWLIKLWPPGFMVIEGLILKLFGLNSPFILILIIINSVLLSFFCSFVELRLRLITNPFMSTIVPLVPFLFPVTRMFLLQPGGVILGEGLAIIMFMFSLIFAQFAEERRSDIYACIAGISLSASAYFRTQFEVIILLLSIVAVIITVIFFFFFKEKTQATAELLNSFSLRIMFIVLAVAHCTMLPWRLHNFHDQSTRSLAWIQKLNNANKTDDELLKAGGSWIVEGRGNIACKLEQKYCGASDASEIYRIFFRHPYEWVLLKMQVLPKYWFAPLENYTNVSGRIGKTDLAVNGILIFTVLLNPLVLFLLRRKPSALICGWHLAAFYGFYLALFLFVHFETRYFYALKICGIFMFVQFTAMWFGALKPKWLTS